MILTQALAVTGSKNMQRGAIRYLGKEMSYAELLPMVGRLSYLYVNDLGYKTRVAFLARNCPAYAASFFALTNTRATIIPIDPDATNDEIIEWVKASGATHLAVTNDLYPKARDLNNEQRLGLTIIEIEKKHGGEYDPVYSPQSDKAPIEMDPILLLRTAGRTGKPHFVSFTHKQLHQAAVSLRGVYRASPTDRFFSNLSWHHPFAFLHAMLFPLILGGTVLVDGGQDGVELMELIRDSRATRLIGTPLFFIKLAVTCKQVEGGGLPGVKSAIVGMGHLPDEVIKALDGMGVRTAHVYGMTENVWTIAMEEANPEDPKKVLLGFVPIPGIKYRVLDDKGEEVKGKKKRSGHLAIESPTVMSSYYLAEKSKSEVETKKAIRGTWLHTGDLVTILGEHDETRLVFHERVDDTLRVGSEFVLPTSVDKTLKQVPGVQDGAGFVAQSGKEEKLLACAVVRAPGSTLKEKEVLDFCSKSLPPLSVPKAVVFTDMIPRDLGGNVDRPRLRRTLSGTVT